jgi:uncharacterized membrane protein YdjX (TVP38/TMEM64 family)
MNPSRWDVKSFEPCKVISRDPTITSYEIFSAVFLEASLWGLGTAIGELPPYFVARAASIAGGKDEGLNELNENVDSLMTKAKRLIYTSLMKNAFLVVLLCASIPNPLFDLAGITCGHFQIPFWTFFGATFFGKAIIKVSI